MRVTWQQLLDSVHPDDLPQFLALIASLTPDNPTGGCNYRVLLSHGTAIWLDRRTRAFFDSNGKMLRVISILTDITDLKMAEETLSRMNRRLIEAQEQERTRIARDLHDDIAQRLGLLTIELGRAQQDPPASTSDTRKLLGDYNDRALK
jgi:signal transduction histidine kinase